MKNTMPTLLIATASVLALAAGACAQSEFVVPDVGSILGDARSAVRDSLADKPIERSLYVERDGTDVLSEPRAGDDIDDIRLTQLSRGETVKLLGELDDAAKNHWYEVEVPRREYDEKADAWKNTIGWVRATRIEAAPAAVPGAPAVQRSVPSFSDDASIARKPVRSLEVGGCREAFVKAMESFLGVKYVWGGTSHHGVDCSGLIQSAMIEAGCVKEAPPRTAADQYRASLKLHGAGEMKEGDLVFLAHPGGRVHHVIGFIGHGQVIEAPHSGDVVRISDMDGRLAGASSSNRIYYGSLLSD